MSLLTLYRPNFCADCGAKIVRLRWHLWTSRRFCGSCVKQFLKEQWLQPLLAGVTLLALGIIVGRAIRPAPPPLLIQRGAAVAATTKESSQPPPATVADEIYLCGARTKKGTPCSRRVHGPVRCWQHKGVPAMLPIDRLRIKE
ncbi:MAG TPA: hypothetical protein VGQ39_22660 [Pyrinomonadaceae bacterium]|nr:hypothetical protein [Pyrinomonadaceae bacterium]